MHLQLWDGFRKNGWYTVAGTVVVEPLHFDAAPAPASQYAGYGSGSSSSSISGL